jgi:osmotically-inducible protein OsmY
MKRTAQYGKTTQNTYGTFRRAGANSDPLSWIHKGIRAYNLAQKAVDATDVETIVENEVTQFLETIL